MRLGSWIRGGLWGLLAFVATLAMAQDIPGGHDHPAIQRAPGTTLVGYTQIAHGNLDFQTSSYVDFDLDAGNRRYATPALALDGRVTRLWYEAPGTTSEQLYQEHAQALRAQGFNTLYDSATDKSTAPEKWVNFLASFAPGKRDAIPTIRSPRVFSSARAASLHTGTYQKDNTTVRLVAVDWPKAEGAVQAHQGAYIAIDLVEARSLRSTGPAPSTSVAAAPAWQVALQRSGRAVLSGVEFASGSAAPSDASRAILAQVAAQLKTQPTLRLFVVGHTDGTGDLQDNLELSQQRAQAVAEALEQVAGLASGRISAHGVGPLAPIADNTSAAGRARNRRIELVRR